MQSVYRLATSYPRAVLALLALLTVLLASQLGKLRWETDARVYMPKGHPAILYDEKVEDVFHVKDALIIAIVNDKKGIFNPETLARIDRITQKVAVLPGVMANRTLDVASLSTATAFVGTADSMGAERLMPQVPTTPEAIERLRRMVYEHADMFVGNIVSADGKAAMIRVKLKEGAVNRYQTYWQIKGILGAEGGGWSEEEAKGDWRKWQAKGGQSSGQGRWPAQGGGEWPAAQGAGTATAAQNGDEFHLAGRPVIEVTSGLHAMEDMKVMIPMLLFVMAVVLFLIFRTGRGVLLPLAVMLGSIIWTMGVMAWLDVPLYTISTMLPVILVAVGIGDAVHLMSSYYDEVLTDPHREAAGIMLEVLSKLGAPLLTTSLTTSIGFLTLLFADMPPFKVFGLFTVLGIGFSWLLTVTLMPAALTLMSPKVGGYLKRRRNMRVHEEQDLLARWLVGLGRTLLAHRAVVAVTVGVLLVAALAGATRLEVNSSWLSDFRPDSDIVRANNLLNARFDGTIFLNIVVEGREPGAIKSLAVLRKMDALQRFVEKQPYVGDSLSVVDYLKSLNKTLHAGDPAYNVLPASQAEIAEALYLYSVSGQPELLDEVVDYNYQRANISVMIRTDQTRDLRLILDRVQGFVGHEFAGLPVTVNYAGSANNSRVWADLLIDSQTGSIVLSKVGILLLALLMLRSLRAGVFMIVPITVCTALVAGGAGVLGIPLDVSTALAAGVAIGVGVDYAVHYIYRYRGLLAEGMTSDAAVLGTLRSVGRTIVFNAVVVTAGFAVLLLSKFPPHVKLGEFVVAYMVLSCVMALVLLPALYRERRC